VNPDFLIPTALALCGLVAGFMIAYASSRKNAPRADRELERRDLEAKRDALIRQLRNPNDDQERARLEQECAAVLRKLEGVGVTPSVSEGPGRRGGTTKPTSAAVGFIWGAGSVAVLALLGYFVMQSAKPREENQPLTGNVGAPTTSTPTATPPMAGDAALTQLENAVRTSPDDIDRRMELAKAYLDRENMMGVYEQTQYVLQKSPKHARALTYGGLVRMAMGQHDGAKQMFDAATKSDPTLLDAWVALAWLDMQSGKRAEAEAAIGEAKKQHPEETQRLDQILAEMKRRASGAAAASAAEPPAGEAPAAPQGPSVHVTIDIDPAAKSRLTPTAVLFVIARAAGVSSGPPAAVKRLPVGTFPIQIDLSQADSMMGQALPPKLRIEARIDSDGNPLTKDPKDPSAAQDNVAAGSSIKLKLH